MNRWPDTTRSTLVRENFLASGNWLMDIMDQSGQIPAIDDALGDKFWVCPFALLNNDQRFKQYALDGYYGTIGDVTLPDTNDVGTSRIPIHFLTYPWGTYGGGTIRFPNVVCSEGIGKIHFKDTTDTIIGETSVTVISENDKLLVKGSTHDQQDHGSITVNRNLSNNKNEIDRLIIDPGYPGFANKGEEAQFKWHNVVTLDEVLKKDSIDDTINGEIFSRETTYTEIRPDGGIHSNTYAKWGEILDIVEDRFGTGNLTQNIINISALMVGLFGGADALTGNTFTPIVFTGLPILWLNSDMKTTVMDGAGGGRSELLKQYSCGMTVRTHYDVDSSYWDRTVINYGSNVYVFDNVMSNATKTSIHFNLMDDPSITKINAKTYFSSHDLSRFRISIFSQNSIDSDTLKAQTKTFAQQGADSLHIFSLSLTDNVNLDTFHNTKFLTELEIAN